MAKSRTGRDQIPWAKREERVEHDGAECQTCGAKGLRKGGTTVLNVHHKQPDPPDRDRHDLRNLVTLCVDCHSWLHDRPTPDIVPIDVASEDERVLRPHDYIILRVLHDYGPLTTTQAHERIGIDVTTQTVRERLWILAGLDYEVSSRDAPLIAKDAVSGDWGLPDQISVAERGQVPSDTRTFMQRVEDELVRRAVARGCDREKIADVFGVVERTIWYRQRRAQAYEFPLDALLDGDLTVPDVAQSPAASASSHGQYTSGEAENTAQASGKTESAEFGEPHEVWGTSTEATGKDDEQLFDG